MGQRNCGPQGIMTVIYTKHSEATVILTKLDPFKFFMSCGIDRVGSIPLMGSILTSIDQ